MKPSIIAVALSAALLAGCTPSEQQSEVATTQVAAKAELGSFGIDLSARNEAIKAGDDFFMYASGTWYDSYEMPADKTRYGAFTALAEKSEERVKAIIEEIAAKSELNAEEKLIRDYYDAFMDTETLDKLGIKPIQANLDAITAVSKVEDLVAIWGENWLNGISAPIWNYLSFNRLDPNAYEISVGAGGLGLPDRSYYLEQGERFDKIRAAYLTHIAQMLDFTGAKDSAAKAEAILALETKIAEGHWPREKRRNRDLTLNQVSRDELKAQYAGFDWDGYFAKTGFKVPALNVSQPEPIKAMIKLINTESLDTWKDYATYHAVKNAAPYLSTEIGQANFDFFGKVLSGQQEQKPRWKRAISAIGGTESLGFALGKVYVDKHFPESSKAQMSELVENLRTAMGQRIDGLDWMGEATKVEARAKLAAFAPKIGYPDEWVSLEGLTLSNNDLVGNMQSLTQFFHARDVADELEVTDRKRWFMPPQQVNAYYNPSFNEIVFPAAILQAPFFDPAADDAVNYGAIGAVIGHEMGHGFDDQGSKSDANGIQRNWWTDEDRAAFEAKADMLAAQYSKYEPIKDNFVNGRNSLGENIGDVGGLAMAYHAYKLSLNGKEAPVIDGLTGDQRFFLAWAQVWKEKRTEESMLNQLRAGTHAPGKVRAQAPRNHDAWYEAFGVKEGDALYLPPEERVRIW
ncbi:M13 family metallopeptidase [Paraferrimonas sp. SM1919]|uniref:M13 family metallopeptidase n=1 Tax=Paraferrimonas sp. SM1919 TaxID=2662263 RepID=UPI0013D8BCD2|nr:M13 family metallopeptidase [Paraferrimonas sp. SM1919]